MEMSRRRNAFNPPAAIPNPERVVPVPNVAPLVKPKEFTVTPPPSTADAPNVFEQALAKAEKAQKEADQVRRTKRHPASITAERLLEAARLYADRMTPAEVRALQQVFHALNEIGAGTRLR